MVNLDIAEQSVGIVLACRLRERGTFLNRRGGRRLSINAEERMTVKTHSIPQSVNATSLIAVLLLLFGSTKPAGASLINDLVTIAYEDSGFPTTNRSEVVTVVDGTSEVSCPGSSVFCQTPSVLVSGETIDIEENSLLFSFNSTAPFPVDTFIGFRILDLDWNVPSTLVGLAITISGLNNLSDSDVSFTSDSVSINFSGVQPTIGGSLLVGFQTEPINESVPEPGTMVLVFGGLAATLARAYTRRRRTASATLCPLVPDSDEVYPKPTLSHP